MHIISEIYKPLLTQKLNRNAVEKPSCVIAIPHSIKSIILQDQITHFD